MYIKPELMAATEYQTNYFVCAETDLDSIIHFGNAIGITFHPPTQNFRLGRIEYYHIHVASGHDNLPLLVAALNKV